MAETRSNGLRISYDDLGQGEPALLLMHGWTTNRTVFKPLVPRCAARRRVLALDWRGHGRSERPAGDFGATELVEDALAVIEASGAQRIVPVALSHAGWIAIELRRRLVERVPRLILLNWIIFDPPPPFPDVLTALQDPGRWRQARDQLFSTWLDGVDNAELIGFVREVMGAHGFEMMARGAREISAAYAQAGNPLRALETLTPPAPVLHVYAQPSDPGYLAAQKSFAASHPWFSVQQLDARSRFPMFETPDDIAAAIEAFVCRT